MPADLEPVILNYLALRLLEVEPPLRNQSIKFGQSLQLQVLW